MASHMYDPDLDSFLEDFTPAAALELGLDIGFLTNYPEPVADLDQIDWDGYGSPTVEDNVPEASQQPTFLDDEDPGETSFEPEFDASVVQPENDNLPGFLYDLNGMAAADGNPNAQKSTPIFQDTVDPGDCLDCAVEDLSNLSGTSNPPGYDLNGSVSRDFELPDNPRGLNFLQNLHLIGSEPAVSSEPNPKTEDRSVLIHPLRDSKGHQGTKQKHYIPNKAYKPLDQAPKAWNIFQYTINGELDPSRLFTADEIDCYLFNHPLHLGCHNSKESQLKLRVHRTPAKSAKRFPSGLFCRFKDCPMRTIGQGQYLVIVDELSVGHPHHDPFLNAAYLHLWCMERYCNFEKICANLNVTARGRDARWEDGRRNRFCLGSEEENVVEDWVEACRARGKPEIGGKPWVTNACPDQPNGCPDHAPPSFEYKGTLCHQLTITKLHYGGQGRINLRKGREERAGYEGANVTRHLGDLSVEAALREFSRCHRNQNQLTRAPKTERHYRAGDRNREEEHAHKTKRIRDERDDCEILGDDIERAPKKPKLIIPIWDNKQEICPGGSPGIPPCATLTPRPQWMRPELQKTARSPRQGCQSASSNDLRLTTVKDEIDGEIELEILAAQRRRRLLEIEDAKDREKECRIKQLKLHEATQKKRSREGVDEDDYRGKRQKV